MTRVRLSDPDDVGEKLLLERTVFYGCCLAIVLLIVAVIRCDDGRRGDGHNEEGTASERR